MDETVLVTGCSSGIGHATAEAFLDDGWQVYAAARDPTDVQALGDRGAILVQLDLAGEDADRAVERVLDEQGRLDALVNNAGYGQFGPLEDVPADRVREQFEVHVFGPHRLARAALPHMREWGEGTVVNVTSAADRLSLAGIGAYAGSKWALSAMSQALRQEVADHGVDVVVVEPGVVATPFYERALAEVAALDRSAAYDDLYRVLDEIGAVEAGGPGVNEPRTVAETVLAAANAVDPEPRYRVGPLATLGALAGTVLPESVRDRAARLGVRAAASEPGQQLLRWWGGTGRGDRREAADSGRRGTDGQGTQ